MKSIVESPLLNMIVVIFVSSITAKISLLSGNGIMLTMLLIFTIISLMVTLVRRNLAEGILTGVVCALFIGIMLKVLNNFEVAAAAQKALLN